MSRGRKWTKPQLERLQRENWGDKKPPLDPVPPKKKKKRQQRHGDKQLRQEKTDG